MRAKINILDNIDRIFLHVCYKQALLGTIGGPVSLISGVEQSLKSYLKKQATAVQLNQTAERHKRRDGIFWEIYAKRPPQITSVVRSIWQFAGRISFLLGALDVFKHKKLHDQDILKGEVTFLKVSWLCAWHWSFLDLRFFD